MKYALILCIALLANSVARADAPATLVYSGTLAAVGEQSVPDADYPATFRIWSAATGGTRLWQEPQIIHTTDSAFTAVLGANGTPLEDSLFIEQTQLWLAIEVDGDVLEPRLQLNSVPWAIRARSAGSLACSGCVGAGAVDDATVQLRVGTGCSVGSAIRSIHADGTVECEVAASYSAGSGLKLAGTTLSVAPDSGACADAQVLTFSAGHGWVCQTPVDMNTAYTAASGLDLTGNTFSLAPDSGSCVDGQLLKYSATNGWTCQNDIDTDTNSNSTYAAGSGLALVGATFSLAPDTGSCSESQVLKYSAMSGWTCRDDVDTDNDTMYSAGSGLTLNGAAFSLAPSSGACNDGQILKYMAANGGWRCEDDIDTFAPLSTGVGLAVNAGVISVDTIVVQQRVSASCPGGTAIQGVNADGSVACVGISGAGEGGGGGGTVTQISTGTGLSGGPITGTGTVSLADNYINGSAYDERFVRNGCSAPTYLGTTPGSYTGRINGYARMHRRCQSAFANSKVCSGADIMKATACLEEDMLELVDGFNAWYADGTTSASNGNISECDGYNSNEVEKLGRVWVGPQAAGVTGEGHPAATSCNTSLPIMCCRL